MLSKKLLAAFAAAALMFGAAACGGDDDDNAATDEVTDVKDEAEEAVEEVADETEADVEDTDSTDTDSTDEDTDFSIPEDFDDCIGVGMTYASVYLAMLGDEDAMKEALGELEGLKVDMPKELQDDFDVLIEGFGEANGIIEAGEFMETDEYTEADENISAFIEEACGS